MSNAINASVPADVLKTARETIASRVSIDVRWQYIEGKHDHFAVVQAICDAIIVERNRCAELAAYEAQSALAVAGSEDARGAAYYASQAIENGIRNPVTHKANPSVTIDDDELPF